ncbi:MAG: ArnT family glycosyltransferase, partial [Planctomycetota bacterium]
MSSELPKARSLPSILGLLIVSALLFLPALDSRDFWQTDEARYAEVARQMQEYGHSWIPHLNGSVYPEKPPFFFWCVMLTEQVCGDYRVASRSVGALGVGAAAFAIILLCRLLGAGARAGPLSALLFLTMVTPLSRGQQGLIDSLLVGLVTWALVCLIASARAGDSWRRLAWGGSAAVLLAAACLCKGPVALLVPVLGTLWLGRLTSGGWRRSWLPMLAGAGFAMSCGCAWLYLASREIGDWMMEYMLFGQISGRSGAGAQHAESWHFYLTRVLPVGLLPWTLLLPACLVMALRGRSFAPQVSAWNCFL